MVQSLWKTVWQFLQKLKIVLPYNPETPFWIYTQRIESIDLKRYLYTYIHTIHNSQKMEATQVSTDRWMEKQTVEYHTNNGILLSLKKEDNSETCFSTDEPWGHYAYWNEQSQKTNTVWFHVNEVHRMVKFTETKSRKVVARGWGGWQMGSYCLMDTVSILQDGKRWWWL